VIIAGAFVLLELSHGQERLVATGITADAHLFALVLEHMITETSLGGEFQVATRSIALERHFTSVDSQMVLQGILTLEGFVATIEGAGEGSGDDMDDLVSHEFGFEAENLSTVGKSTVVVLLSITVDFLAKVSRIAAGWAHFVKVVNIKVVKVFHD
jgi:hypothetical protein